MSENQNKKLKNYQFRANLPGYFRIAAFAGLILVVIGVGIGFYLNWGRETFRMKSLPTNLSDKVVAEVNGYERRESDNGITNYYIKADKAKTFTDNHQELENMFLQVFDETGESSDKITAESAIYVPKENDPKNFTVYLAGNVNVETRDELKVKTDNLTYKKETEVADAEEYIEFLRENISGHSTGAIVRIREKKVELMNAVEIDAFALNPTDELAKSDIKTAHLKADYAMFDQIGGKIELNNNVRINVVPDEKNQKLSQPTDISANFATALFTDKQLKQIDLRQNVEVYQKPTANNPNWTRTKAEKATAKIDKEVKSLELDGNVDIETTMNDVKPTKITSAYALYTKDSDRFELRNAVHIITTQSSEPTDIKANEAIYEQANGNIFLTGNAEIWQTNNFVKGDKLTARLFPSKQLKSAEATGNAYLKQVTDERTAEVYAPQLNAVFGENKQMQNANALGASRVNIVPASASDYSKLSLSAPNAIRLNFQNSGLLSQMQTEGRTTIYLDAPNNSPDAANKKLTADSVITTLQPDGKNLAKAQAIGNAELYVEPLRATAENYNTTLTAPKFDCDFYPTGNNAKNCSAFDNAKAVRVPTVVAATRGKQTLSAKRLNAIFNQGTRDIQQFDAVGDTKFNELDRNGIADNMTFTSGDGFIKLRGGEPTVWDSSGRAKAGEIDWDTRGKKQSLRNTVSTTYYSQKTTGETTPFSKSNDPVFITANAAEFDQTAETAVYTGNARAWQENNYVRGERLILKQKEGQFFADTNVQSLLYDVEKKENGKTSNQPVYAQADKLFYAKDKNILRYEGSVDIRQGTDRITAGVANVFLDNKNELKQTIAEQNVVVTQPNRKATGDYAQYTAENEVVILRGNPATVSDAEQGSSQSAQLTVYLRENRAVGEGKTEENSGGRIRSVYKVKKP